MNSRDNDHVELHELRGFASPELRGFASPDLLGAFLEVEAAATGTRCTQPFFSVSINPPTGYPAHFDQYELAAASIEARFPALADQPRAIVFHEKEGRRHAHIVWSRIDTERARAVPLSHSRLKLRTASLALYQSLGIEPPAGLKDSSRADPLNYDRKTWQQAKRLGEDPRDLKQIIQQAWQVSDNRASFESALERHALYLARGDRRGFVVVHHSGDTLSLTRYAGLKTREIEARIGKPEHLQTVDQVHGVLQARMTATAQQRQADMRGKHAGQLRPLAGRLMQLRTKHRADRAALREDQAGRSDREELRRASRLRSGIMGLWDRLSGRRGRVSADNAREAAAGRIRDRDESQSLIDRQGTERRELQKEITQVRDKQKHERTYARSELAVMLSMMKDSTREQFQKHGQEIEAAKGEPGADRSADWNPGGRESRERERERPRPRPRGRDRDPS